MKSVLTRLTLHNFRGTRFLEVLPAGKNVGIVGPNGSGKSSVMDALDFLLTGQIRRLTGDGAKVLNLAKHGPHVDSSPEAARVEGEFETGGKTVVLKRAIGNPDALDVTGVVPDGLRRWMQLAARGGHHLLTRREILRFICAEPSSRGQHIAALLDLSRVDTVRKELQGAAREAKSAETAAKVVVQNRISSLVRSFTPHLASEADTLRQVNAHRIRLGGSATTALEPQSIRHELTSPAAQSTDPLAGQRVRELLDRVLIWADESLPGVTRQLHGYWDRVELFRTNPEHLRELRSTDLVERGIKLLSADQCPLCLTSWEQDELRAFLSARLQDAAEASAEHSSLLEARAAVEGEIARYSDLLSTLATAVKEDPQVNFVTFTDAAKAVRDNLINFAPDPLVGRVATDGEREAYIALLSARAVRTVAGHLKAVIDGLPAPSDQQRLWEELAAVETALKELQIARVEQAEKRRFATELEAASQHFITARDEVLQETYDAIAGRMQSLYRALNRDDEGGFEAVIQPTKAGILLEVDFFNRGQYPPHALHSEGHQDNMGICLFLALNEHLCGQDLPLMMLDDVLMSVDRGHRRAFAELLGREFKSTQFVITTHDRVWWRQLRSLGVIPATGAVEFQDWSIDRGPICSSDSVDALTLSRTALEKGNVPQAAHALRHAVETAFPEICHSLGASVRFRADHAWGAGEFLSAAMSRYAALLNKARTAAKSWGHDETALNALDDQRREASAGFDTETWAINVNVHFNEWADFQVNDFRPVLDAYVRLFALYRCTTCGSWVRCVEEGVHPLSLRCECQGINLNLRVKTKIKAPNVVSSVSI